MTLIEILVSLALALVGMAALYATLGTAIGGSSFAARFAQAQLRAEAILEAIRLAPASSLACLANTPAPSWSICEADCKAHQTGSGATLAQSCIFTAASFSNVSAPPSGSSGIANQSVDRAGVVYSLVYDNQTAKAYRSTFVLQNGPGNRVYDAQITVGWNDNATATTPNHYVTLRTGVFN